MDIAEQAKAKREQAAQARRWARSLSLTEDSSNATPKNWTGKLLSWSAKLRRSLRRRLALS